MSLAASLGYAQTPQEVARIGFASTVTVLLFDEAGDSLGLGSGFVVAPELVVTNAHVIAGAHTALVRGIGASSTHEVIAVEKFDTTTDLAVLRAPSLALPAIATTAVDAPSVGDAIFAVGSPLGLEGTFTQGIVSGYRSLEGVSLMQITAPISPGSSGGPVLNINGRVVGVAVGAYEGGQSLNFAVPVTDVVSLLQGAADPKPVQAYADSTAPPRGSSGAQELVEAIDFGGLTLSVTGRFAFSARNNLPRPVRNVTVSVTFFDVDDFPVSTREVAIGERIEPGLAIRNDLRLQEGVQELITGERFAGTEIRSRVEFRVLSFEYAE